MNKKRLVFVGVLLVGFGLGSYVWKIKNTGAMFWRSQGGDVDVENLDFTVYVGDYLITREEINWEYQFYMQQLSAAETGSLAEVGEADPSKEHDTHTKPNFELYNKILADLIERKLLYQHISADVRFSLQEPSRYTRCLQEWMDTVGRMRSFFKNEMERDRLKSMLCEKDILLQYIEERIAGAIEISEKEVREYYEHNRKEFVEPPKVMIRQIVVGTENEAKQVVSKVTPQNFAAMAKEYSISPEAQNGGLVGPFAKDGLPSFFDVAFEMKPGTIQGVLKSPYGFHILMLEKKLPRVELRFEDAREKIIKTLTKKRRDEDYKKWVETALNSIPIKSSRPF